MSLATSIVIVRPEHVVSVRKRMAETELVAVISESELLSLQDAILAQPPEVLVMHAAFASTSRGASLISALKLRPRETGTAIRVFLEDEVKSPLILADPSLAAVALLETSRPLERAGTRQAARYPMNRRAVGINGEAGELLDLSVSGAQVQSPVRLRPMKVARLVLPDSTGEVRVQGTVAWAIAVPGSGTIEYRAGVEFVNPDRKKLAMFCTVYGSAPDPTLGTIDR